MWDKGRRFYTAQNQSEEDDANPTFYLYTFSTGKQLHESNIDIIAHTVMKFNGLISVFHKDALNPSYDER